MRRLRGFVQTGNAEAIDLICTRYSCGSPSQYLRNVASVKDICTDYALAMRCREKDVIAVTDDLRNRITRLRGEPDPQRVTAVALQCLVQIMSSK